MAWIRNILALIGLAVIVLIIVVGVKYSNLMNLATDLDPKAGEVYLEMAQRLAETGNAAEATVWRVKVDEGMSAEYVEDVLKSVAIENNIKNVGELPLYKQVAAMSGEDYRFVKIYMYCNALTAAKMMDYSDAFSAYLPCRLSLLEDQKGDLWIYTLNMDLMIHGGKPLPPDLKKEAEKVKSIIQEIMNRAASGAF